MEQLLLRLQVDGGVIISDYYTYCTLHIDTFSYVVAEENETFEAWFLA